MVEMEAWSARARNLPEHAGNPIHTDEGGRAAGFDAALVAGVTVYAYLTRPIVEAWGMGQTYLRGLNGYHRTACVRSRLCSRAPLHLEASQW